MNKRKPSEMEQRTEQAHREIREALKVTEHRIDLLMAKIRSKVARAEQSKVKLVKVPR